MKMSCYLGKGKDEQRVFVEIWVRMLMRMQLRVVSSYLEFS